VVYASSSSALATGSVLSFDGTNLGIGTNSPQRKLHVKGGAGLTQFESTSSTCYVYLGGSTSSSIDNQGIAVTGNDLLALVGGNERLRITSAGDVGIGTSSPAYPLDVVAASVGAFSINMRGRSSDNIGYMRFSSNNGSTNYASIGIPSANTLAFDTNSTERMRIDSSGNLLIGGTTAPTSSTVKQVIQTASGGFAQFGVSGGTGGMLGAGGENLLFYTYTGSLGSETYTERARISSGNLMVGTTSIANTRIAVAFDGNTNNGSILRTTTNASGCAFFYFQEDTNTCGSILRVGTTSAVVYNTTSDYRLKTVTGAVTGQGSRIDALKPIDYFWKEGNHQSRGFLAHEFQTVYPNSVSGDKDAVDENGNPKYQAMQASSSEVIADLVAEIQSLRQRLSAANL
jgi:hypothetical protein